MDNMLDVIKKRYSVRTYSSRPIEAEKIKTLQEYIASGITGPFGTRPGFKLIGTDGDAAEELKKLVSYGVIKGCRTFLAGAVKKNDANAMTDYGYCLEEIILFATALGLGTVWLGGTFNRSTFSKKMEIKDNEVIPAVTPIGYAADSRSMVDVLMRTVSGGKKRKPFDEIFFSDSLSKPLQKEACGKYGEVLEAVRWAPSASNKQPWRIIKEDKRNVFHFYMNENPAYSTVIKDVRLQNIDLGIAMCHFELASAELRLKGYWGSQKPSQDAGNLVYIATWKGEP